MGKRTPLLMTIDDITNRMSAQAASAAASGVPAHTHPETEITNLALDLVNINNALAGKATPADIATAIANLVDSSPTALDTLKELATSLGNDAHFSTTVLNALSGKAALSHTHSIADVTGLVTALAAIGTLYVSGVLKHSFPVGGAAVAGAANVVFQLTTNGLSTGPALFPNGNVYLETLMLRPEEGTSPHTFGVPVLSNSNKTLTIPVTKIASLLGVLTLNQPATGSSIKMLVFGD